MCYRAYKDYANIVKIVINNVISAIKGNASMLSLQDINDYLAKYTTVLKVGTARTVSLNLYSALTLSYKNSF
jgi:hypothetical protein